MIVYISCWDDLSCFADAVYRHFCLFCLASCSTSLFISRTSQVAEIQINHAILPQHHHEAVIIASKTGIKHNFLTYFYSDFQVVQVVSRLEKRLSLVKIGFEFCFDCKTMFCKKTTKTSSSSRRRWGGGGGVNNAFIILCSLRERNLVHTQLCTKWLLSFLVSSYHGYCSLSFYIRRRWTDVLQLGGKRSQYVFRGTCRSDRSSSLPVQSLLFPAGVIKAGSWWRTPASTTHLPNVCQSNIG